MATLTVDVTLLPNAYSDVGLTVNAWLASLFIRNPSGQTLPISGSPTGTAVTNSSGVASVTGLTSGTAYWIQVVDPLGYYHWFLWGSALAIPGTLQANINMPGIPVFGLTGPQGATGATGETGATGATGPAGPSYTVLSKNNTYTINTLEAVEADATSGAFTITTADNTAGHSFKITKVDSSTHAVTIALSAGNINGSASIQLTRQYQSVEIRTDGTNGYIN